jgi:phosphohistidine phosphatase
MDLIFWRHAEAEDWTEGCDDMARALTPRGEKQAKRMASWLDRQLPDGARILCSPALRCEQTVLALGRKYKLRKSVVLLVGHQPSLGQAISLLLGLRQDSCAVRKGSLWWLRTRERDGDTQTIVQTVQAPELI